MWNKGRDSISLSSTDEDGEGDDRPSMAKASTRRVAMMASRSLPGDEYRTDVTEVVSEHGAEGEAC